MKVSQKVAWHTFWTCFSIVIEGESKITVTVVTSIDIYTNLRASVNIRFAFIKIWKITSVFWKEKDYIVYATFLSCLIVLIQTFTFIDISLNISSPALTTESAVPIFAFRSQRRTVVQSGIFTLVYVYKRMNIMVILKKKRLQCTYMSLLSCWYIQFQWRTYLCSLLALFDNLVDIHIENFLECYDIFCLCHRCFD